ncbi:DUF262 domain-containing protein [Methylocystis sp. JR02]|uniref:DUF262 domain-containing protein n=1 Tax=Methylocystis sp. JR02 TaxID=3046284 RepID=UPI0024B9A056|nr:DUF262 domain-containing protein [Methylocystis sp. JR02]MDJ0450539.1 DUF262 domain-containing protein [Methylocystis sp. JR02]
MSTETKQDRLVKEIDTKIGEVRTEAVDLSFGEIINLQDNKEIKIDPEYQRLFRWSDEQKSRLVESILLRLPIPQIFFIENEDGTLELIDGLQRISSMIQFIQSELIGKKPLKLSGCNIIGNLNDCLFDDLPLALKLQLKRSSVRAIIVKRQSKYFLRYEMFKRLNAGGSELSEQELRNCSARLFGGWGIEFYNKIIEMSYHPSFVKTTETLADSDLEKRGREELSLRFFAAKDGSDYYAGHVANWLDDFMEAVLLTRVPFPIKEKQAIFCRTFDCIERVLGESAFCKFKDNRPIGGLAPAHYEAISVAFSRNIEKCESTDKAKLYDTVTQARQSAQFRENVGPGANKKSKLAGRVAVIEEAIKLA